MNTTNSLNRKAKKELIAKLIVSLEIKRDDNYNIEITNIKFTDEFISKSSTEYIEYLYKILNNNNIGIKYKELVTDKDLEKLNEKYLIVSSLKMENNLYSKPDYKLIEMQIDEHFYTDGIICCPHYRDNTIIDTLLLIPKTKEDVSLATT